MPNEYKSFYRRELLEMVDSVTLKAIEKASSPMPQQEGMVFPKISGIMLMRRLIREELEHDTDDS